MRVGSDHHPWNGVIGSQGTGKCNSNGLLRLWLCSTYDLVITNTLLCLPTCNKTSWMHPRSKHWHLVHYIITRKKMQRTSELQRPCVEQTVGQLSKVNLKITPKRCPQGKKVFKKLDVSRLKHKLTAEVLCSDLNKTLENLTLGDALVEDNLTAFKNIVYSTAFEHFGPSKQHNQDLFDENDAKIMSLNVEKIASRGDSQSNPCSAFKKAAFANMCKEVQSTLCKMWDEWLSKKADEIRAILLISMTQKVSMRHWNVFMVLSHLDPHCSSVQMEPSSSLIKIKSLRDGQNISVLFSTSLHQSMMRQFNHFHKYQSIMNLMHHPLSVKLKRPLGSYQMARHPGLVLYQLKSTNMVVLYYTRSWLTSSSPYGSKVLHHKTSRIHLSFISTREKEIANSVTITMAYHSCP